MKQRQLGAQGPHVSAIGLGCMSFAGAFGPTDTETSLRCLDAAVAHGLNFLDTANIYGMGRSEEVIGQWLATRRPNVVLATKGGIVRDPQAPVNNSPAHFRQELEGSLKRLGVDHVALYYAHRHDPAVPPEELAGTLGRFIDEGKIGGYGLSEVAPATIRRAHAERPCTAVQNEYSLWTRLPELGVIQTTAELGIAFVPFSPLGRGVLSDTPPNPAAMAEDDFRRAIPRFSDENYPRNAALLAPFRAYAAQVGRSTAELAMAWVLDRGAHLLPIPGTRTAAHLNEWINAADKPLSDAERADIARLLPPGFAHGDRYGDIQTRTAERYC